MRFAALNEDGAWVAERLGWRPGPWIEAYELDRSGASSRLPLLWIDASAKVMVEVQQQPSPSGPLRSAGGHGCQIERSGPA